LLVSKAKVLEKVLDHLTQEEPLDFIFCVGDDRSDEDNFQFLAKYQGLIAPRILLLRVRALLPLLC
jgi:trehalose-6-phosphatase